MPSSPPDPFLSLASLSWQEGLQNWVAIGLPAALFALAWAYRGKPGAITVRIICLLSKLLAVALLLMCILEPRWMRKTVLPRANSIAIVLDNSDSLNIPGGTDGQTRLEMARNALAIAEGSNGWIPPLEKDFQIQRFVLGSQLTPLSSFEGAMPPPATSSQLHSTLRQLQTRFSRQSLAAVILISDGQSTQPTGEPMPEGFPPVYTILPTPAPPPPDLAIQDVHITQSQFEDAPVTVEAHLKTQGFEGRTISLNLLDPAGETVQSETRELPAQPTNPTVKFQFNPKTTGLAFYQLQIQEKTGEDGEPLAEATDTNNRRVLAVHQPSQPFRILYLSGRPNWEYKFLRRALEEEDKMHLVGLIRVARKEARFEFRGRTGESSNPLFRGFKDQNDGEEEQYDEPVLIRLNTRDKDELLNGFPDTAEGLYPYHAIILDDIESSFFSRQQHSLLDKFVSERGGGLLMLGGQETYQEGGYQKTPIGNILPVYLGASTQATFGTGQPASKWGLTREGWLTPWARLRNKEVDEKKVQAEIPPFLVYNPSNGLKPGSTLIASLATPANPTEPKLPALVEQRLGKGRVLSILVGDLWRWAMKDAETQPEHQKFWRQTLRHLLADVPEPTTIQIQPSEDPFDPAVRIIFTARSNEFIPLENAKPELRLASPDGKESLLPLESSGTEAATWSTKYLPMQTGAYNVKSTLYGSDGKTLLGTIKSGWVTHHPSAEHRDHTANTAYLQKLAAQTKGDYLQLEGLPALAKKLPELQAPVMHEWSKPLWHNPWVLALVISLLAAEWALRKKHQLA